MFTMTVEHRRMHKDEIADFDHLRALGMGVKSAKEYMVCLDTPYRTQDFGARGGRTIVWLWDNDVFAGMGVAECSPVDSYCKKKGIYIALCKLFESQPHLLEELADDDSASAFEIKRRFPDIFCVETTATE